MPKRFKVPERQPSKGELLNLHRPRQTHGPMVPFMLGTRNFRTVVVTETRSKHNGDIKTITPPVEPVDV